MQEDQEREGQQRVPVKLYRTTDRIVVAAPMPGLQPDDVTVEVTADDRLVLHGERRGVLKEEVFEVQGADVREGHPPVQPSDPDAPRERWLESKVVLLDEWDVGGYHRELDLPVAVDGPLGTATYGNGVLVVALPVAERTLPARLSLETVAPGRGQRVGSAGHPIQPLSTEEHRAAQDTMRAED